MMVVAAERGSHCSRCCKPHATLGLYVLTHRNGGGVDLSRDVYRVTSTWMCAGWFCLGCLDIVRRRGIRDRHVWRALIGAREAITFGGWSRTRDTDWLEKRRPGSVYLQFLSKRWHCKTMRGERMRPPSAFEDLDRAFEGEIR